MISSGLFVLPGQAFKIAGPAVVLSYALAAVMVIPALLAKAELATAMPKSGGSYFFVERSMGALPGTLAGLANWLSIALKSAFAMVGIGAFAKLLWPEARLTDGQWIWLIKGLATACCVLFTVLNILSVKAAGWVQIVFVGGLLLVLGFFVVAGFPNVRQHPNFDHLMESGFGDIVATSALVFVSFGGLTKVASVAGEVRHPGRNVPAAMFLAYVVVSLLYVMALLVVVGVTEADALAAGPYGSLTPLSLAAGKFLGRGGVVLLSAAAVFAFVTTGNSGILAASRSPMAMSRDGLLPSALGKIHPRCGTPVVSILLTGGFMATTILLLTIPDLVKVASTMMLMLFLMVNVAVLIMRSSRLQNYRPLYRCPLFPWMQLLGIGLYGALIGVLSTRQGAVPLITTIAFAAAGTLWYFFYVLPRGSRESALVYMVRSVVAKEIYRSELEEELREIALERDEVIYDRFDKLVQSCEILDLPGPASADEMFSAAAELLAKRMKIDAGELLEKFKRRETESSTMIGPHLAIPHVILDGERLFDILPVRSRGGILFGENRQPVHMAFILVGSRDERNYHLRALMTVAQIVREPGFAERWLEAPGVESLRDILLLAERQRHKEG